jgi:5-hydroxyisourate hydrolase
MSACRSENEPRRLTPGSSNPAATGEVAASMTLSTHVLDATSGRPAPNVALTLHRRAETGTWEPVGEGVTDDDGRCRTLAPDGLRAAIYRLDFDTGAYFVATGQKGFYPEVSIVFEVTEPTRHHHVPLLLSPFAYSTYRGS